MQHQIKIETSAADQYEEMIEAMELLNEMDEAN